MADDTCPECGEKRAAHTVVSVCPPPADDTVRLTADDWTVLRRGPGEQVKAWLTARLAADRAERDAAILALADRLDAWRPGTVIADDLRALVQQS